MDKHEQIELTSLREEVVRLRAANHRLHALVRVLEQERNQAMVNKGRLERYTMVNETLIYGA